MLDLSACSFRRSPAGRCGFRLPRTGPGERGEQAKGDQTVFAVVVLAVVLPECAREGSTPAAEKTPPEAYIARNAVTRPRIALIPVRARLLRRSAEESIGAIGAIRRK